MFLESTQNQRCFNVEFYGWINVDKSTLNQRGYQVDRRHDAISTYINVESTLSVCWAVPNLTMKDFSVFKTNNFKSIRPSSNSVFNCDNPRRIFIFLPC